MTKDTGGPAYPNKIQVDDAGTHRIVRQKGMTLLDVAALAALPEMLRIHPREAIKHAYDQAEEFIAEKRRRESE